VLTALAHVIVTEGLFDEAFIRERCDWSEFEDWAGFVADPAPFAGSAEALHRRAGGRAARRGAALCPRRQWRDLLRPRRHRAQPGLDHGDGDRQPRHGHRQYRPARASA
jgi:anaerobic selenocysteine-containing dehydrogenase